MSLAGSLPRSGINSETLRSLFGYGLLFVVADVAWSVLVSISSPANTDELIKVLFRVQTWWGPMSHVFGAIFYGKFPIPF